MVVVPRWLTFLIAGIVIVFGLFRMYLAYRGNQAAGSDAPATSFQRRGMYAMSPRRHILFGLVYLILGAFLIASAFGYSPFRTEAKQDSGTIDIQ